MVCGRMASHSSNRSGRLSMHDGSRKPYSASVAFLRKSPRYMPPSCGTVTWLSSTNTSALSGHVFEQRRRRLARLAAGEIARIVLDAGAAAGRLHHFEVEERALLQPLRLQQPAGGVQLVEPPLQLLLDAGDRLQQRRPRRHIVRVGVDLDEFQLVGLLPGQRIEFVDRFDLVAEQRARARRGPRSGPGRSRPRRRARGTCRARSRRRCACIAAPPDRR